MDGFLPARSFQGTRPGYVYKMGDGGLGYYPDNSQSVPMASQPPSSALHTPQGDSHRPVVTGTGVTPAQQRAVVSTPPQSHAKTDGVPRTGAMHDPGTSMPPLPTSTSTTASEPPATAFQTYQQRVAQQRLELMRQQMLAAGMHMAPSAASMAALSTPAYDPAAALAEKRRRAEQAQMKQEEEDDGAVGEADEAVRRLRLQLFFSSFFLFFFSYFFPTVFCRLFATWSTL